MNYNFWLFYIGGMLAALVGLKSKNKNVCLLLNFIAIFFVLSSAATESDLITYERHFMGIDSFVDVSPAIDWAYYNLMHCLKLLGCNFREAKAVFMMLLILLMYNFLRVFSPNVKLFFGFFFMFAMVFQTSFILRNGIGFMIALQGFWILISEEKYRTWKYILLILIASQFHSSLYLLLIFAIIDVKLFTLKKYRKLIIPIVIACVFGFIGLIRSGIFVSAFVAVIGNVLQSDKYTLYAVTRGRYAWLVVVFIWVITIVTSVYFAKKALQSEQWGMDCYQGYQMKKGVVKYTFFRVDRSDQIMRLLKIIIISSFFIPLLIYGLHLYRYLHYIALLYVTYMGLIYSTSNNCNLKLKSFICTFLIMGAWLFFEIFVYGIDLELLNKMMVQGSWFWK